MDEGETSFCSAIVIIAEELSGCGEDVVTLSSPTGRATWSLIGDGAEELTFGILPAALIPIICRYGDELLAEELLDFGIWKDQQPVSHAIVSYAAKRMAIHLPEVDRLPCVTRFTSCFPKVSAPLDLRPCGFLSAG